MSYRLLVIIIFVLFLYLSLSKSLNKQCLKALPVYNPNLWNQPNTRKYNNCYAYAFRNLEYNRDHKPQPGETKGYSLPKPYSCNDLLEAIRLDHPDTYFESDPHKKCQCDYRKIF